MNRAPSYPLAKAAPAAAQNLGKSQRLKMAEVIARRIEDQIVTDCLEVGHLLGSEAELATDARVSRWTFREAIALLESSGLVESRRGTGGGLFVAAHQSDMVCTELSNYLVFVHTPPREVAMALRAVDAVLIRRLSGKLGRDSTQSLDAAATICSAGKVPESFNAAATVRPMLLQAARDPALKLVCGAMTRIVGQSAWYSMLDDAQYEATFSPLIEGTRDVARALIEGRDEDALAASARYAAGCEVLLGTSALMGQMPGRAGAAERAYRIFPADRPAKKAERIARELREIVIDAGWPVGMQLGTQSELMTRFGVGRPVLREALRSLERLGVIECGRGGASGVKVISPNPSVIIASCCRYLRREGLGSARAKEVLSAIARYTAPNAESGVPPVILPLLKSIFKEALSTPAPAP